MGEERASGSGAYLKERRLPDHRAGKLIPGTLEMLVLKALSLEPMHGWGLAHSIEAMSGRAFLVSQGSLWPALVRMRRRGWIASSWQTTSRNRRGLYYTLTPKGERQLVNERAAWQRAASAVNAVLGTHSMPVGVGIRR